MTHALNWLAYNYRDQDGYGRYSLRLVTALRRRGVMVQPQLAEMTRAPAWLHHDLGLDWARLTISCLPPVYLHPVPGRHWLLTMTEGSVLPDGWADAIQRARVERLIVPCQHNADAFAVTGLPVAVVPGGTDPAEFPLIASTSAATGAGEPAEPRPYTFLALADRGARKGWVEVWQAFYQAFGGPADTPDVRLIIKSRPDGNEMLALISQADHPDPRITILMADCDMRDFYRSGDCFVIPSRSEGWGMPHREAAMMGLPVITQRYSGMDDGYTSHWATVIGDGTLEAIPTGFQHIAGAWLRADIPTLAAKMRFYYEHPAVARYKGACAADWLRKHQTWDDSARRLLWLIESEEAWR